MRRSRFTEEQIIGALKELEAGVRVVDVCRRLGVSEATVQRWRAKYGGLEVSEAKRWWWLEEATARLKEVVAGLTLSYQRLREALAKNW